MVGEAGARDVAHVISDETPRGTTHRRAMKKTKKKQKARKRLERAWAWQTSGGLTAPWVVRPVLPLARAEPSEAAAGSWADEDELALDQSDAAACPWMNEGELGAEVADVGEGDDAGRAADAGEATVAGTTPDDRDVEPASSPSIERHDPASDPPALPSRPEPLAVRSLNNGTPRTWTNRDPALARKALLTAGPEAGSWVGAIAGTSSEPTDITLNVYLGDGSADYLVGAVTVPAGAGTGSIPAVNLLADTSQLPWVSTEGSFTIPAGWQVSFENVTAPAVGAVSLVPFGGDY